MQNMGTDLPLVPSLKTDIIKQRTCGVHCCHDDNVLNTYIAVSGFKTIKKKNPHHA